MTKRIRLGALTGLAAAWAASACAENWTEYRTCAETRSEVLIEGTSTLHAWTVRGRTLEGVVRLSEQFYAASGLEEGTAGNESDILPIEGKLAIPSRSLRSFRDGRPYSDRMDEIMYEKLKVTEHPEIVFELERLQAASGAAAEAGSVSLMAQGKLSVAGASRAVAVPLELRRIDDRRLRLTGKIDMKMTQFGIDPPRAMAGTIRTGDEITVRVTWVVAREG